MRLLKTLLTAVLLGSLLLPAATAGDAKTPDSIWTAVDTDSKEAGQGLETYRDRIREGYETVRSCSLAAGAAGMALLGFRGLLGSERELEMMKRGMFWIVTAEIGILLLPAAVYAGVRTGLAHSWNPADVLAGGTP